MSLEGGENDAALLGLVAVVEQVSSHGSSLSPPGGRSHRGATLVPHPGFLDPAALSPGWRERCLPAVASTPSPTFRRESRRARLHRRRLPPLHLPARRRRPGGWGSSSLRQASAANDQR